VGDATGGGSGVKKGGLTARWKSAEFCDSSELRLRPGAKLRLAIKFREDPCHRRALAIYHLDAGAASRSVTQNDTRSIN
jgi:hypothetical protein